MKRGRSTGTPTKAEHARMDAITEHGCIIAHHLGIYFQSEYGDRLPMPGEVHHLTVGGKHGQKRRGHAFTVCLNPYSHRGVPFGPWSLAECRRMFGPSYAREPRAFRELYSDDWLLAKQAEVLGVVQLEDAA